MKFHKRYMQALGSITGMIICIYSYLRGDLITYSSLAGNYDSTTINKILASYILYPLCITTFIALAYSYLSPNYEKQSIINTNIHKIISSLIYITVIVGLLGCGIYFILPSLLLTYYDILLLVNRIRGKDANDNSISEIKNEKSELNPILTMDRGSKNDHIKTRNEMAIHLLNQNSDIGFIMDITGFSLDSIKKIQSECLCKQE